MYRRFTSHEVQEFAHRLSERLEKARRERDTLTIADHESILKELEETTEALEIAGEELRVQSDELTSAAQAMEVEAARFQRLFELAPDPILTTDLMGTIVEANRAATRFLGVSREGLRRKPLAAFLASTSRGHFRAYLTRAARLEAVGEVELHVRTRGSENMTVDARAAYLPPSAYGQPELAWRLTPRRGAERGEGQAADGDGALVDLREQVRRAEQEALSRNRMMAAISHEIRTPLQSIMGYAELLLSDIPEPLPESGRRQVQSIAEGARHLAALVDDVLRFHREEDAAQPLSLSEVGVAELLEGCEVMVGEAVRAAGATLEVQAPPELTLRTDGSKLRQILLNLMGNSVKFTGKGTITVSAHQDGTWVTFRVSDTGPGIDPSDVPHIFEPFWRGRPGPRNRNQGAGLGLALVRALVKRLDGKLDLDTAPGRGTTFVVSLPRIPPED